MCAKKRPELTKPYEKNLVISETVKIDRLWELIDSYAREARGASMPLDRAELGPTDTISS